MKKLLFVLILIGFCLPGFAQLQPRKNPITEKWGYVNKKDKWIISPQFDKAEPFEKKGKYATIMLDGKYGCINTKGELSIKPVFTDYDMLRHARQELELGNKVGTTIYPLKGELGTWGFVNHVGDWTINPDYDDVGEFGSNMFVAVNKGGKWGCVSKKGETVVMTVFATRKIAERAGLEAQNKAKKGAMLFPLQNDNDGKWGFANYVGEWVINPAYQEVKGFNTEDDKLAYVMVDGKWGAINRKEKFVIAAIFDLKQITNASMEYQNKAKRGATLYPIFDNYKSLWGFVDYVGKELIPPTYQEVKDIYNDKYIAVLFQGKWGVIDKKGKFQIAPVFHDVDKAGSAMVELDKGTKQNRIFYPEYDDAMKAWGYVNIIGEWVIAPIFTEANPFDGKEAMVMIQGQKRLINKKGKYVDGLPEPQYQPAEQPAEQTEDQPAEQTETPSEEVIEAVTETAAEESTIQEVTGPDLEDNEEEAVAPSETAEEAADGEEAVEGETETEQPATELPGEDIEADVTTETPVVGENEIDSEINDILKEFE